MPELDKLWYTLGIETGEFERSLSRVENNWQGFYHKVAGIGASLGLAFGFTQIINEADQLAKSFESAMAKIWSITDITKAQLNGLGEEIKKLAVETGKSAEDIAGAMYQAISSGISQDKAMDFMKQAIDLSKAGVADLFTTVDGLTSVMNSYKMSVDDVKKVSDMFFMTTKDGKTEISNLAGSLGQVTAIANSAGVSLDELLGAIAQMTAGGLGTSESITALRQAIASILSPSEQAKKMAESLGIQFNESALRSKGFAEFLNDAVVATNGSKESLSKLFGSVEALNGVLMLTGENTANYSKFIGDIKNSAGATDEAVAKMNMTAEQAAAVMRQQLNQALMEFGNALLPIETAVMELLNPFAQWLGNMSDGDKIILTFTAALMVLPGIINNIRNSIVLAQTATMGWLGVVNLIGAAVGSAVVSFGMINVAIENNNKKTLEADGNIKKIGTGLDEIKKKDNQGILQKTTDLLNQIKNSNSVNELSVQTGKLIQLTEQYNKELKYGNGHAEATKKEIQDIIKQHPQLNDLVKETGNGFVYQYSQLTQIFELEIKRTEEQRKQLEIQKGMLNAQVETAKEALETAKKLKKEASPQLQLYTKNDAENRSQKLLDENINMTANNKLSAQDFKKKLDGNLDNFIKLATATKNAELVKTLTELKNSNIDTSSMEKVKEYGEKIQTQIANYHNIVSLADETIKMLDDNEKRAQEKVNEINTSIGPKLIEINKALDTTKTELTNEYTKLAKSLIWSKLGTNTDKDKLEKYKDEIEKKYKISSQTIETWVNEWNSLYDTAGSTLRGQIAELEDKLTEFGKKNNVSFQSTDTEKEFEKLLTGKDAVATQLFIRQVEDAANWYDSLAEMYQTLGDSEKARNYQVKLNNAKKFLEYSNKKLDNQKDNSGTALENAVKEAGQKKTELENSIKENLSFDTILNAYSDYIKAIEEAKKLGDNTLKDEKKETVKTLVAAKLKAIEESILKLGSDVTKITESQIKVIEESLNSIGYDTALSFGFNEKFDALEKTLKETKTSEDFNKERSDIQKKIAEGLDALSGSESNKDKESILNNLIKYYENYAKLLKDFGLTSDGSMSISDIETVVKSHADEIDRLQKDFSEKIKTAESEYNTAKDQYSQIKDSNTSKNYEKAMQNLSNLYLSAGMYTEYLKLQKDITELITTEKTEKDNDGFNTILDEWNKKIYDTKTSYDEVKKLYSDLAKFKGKKDITAINMQYAELTRQRLQNIKSQLDSFKEGEFTDADLRMITLDVNFTDAAKIGFGDFYTALEKKMSYLRTKTKEYIAENTKKLEEEQDPEEGLTAPEYSFPEQIEKINKLKNEFWDALKENDFLGTSKIMSEMQKLNESLDKEGLSLDLSTFEMYFYNFRNDFQSAFMNKIKGGINGQNVAEIEKELEKFKDSIDGSIYQDIKFLIDEYYRKIGKNREGNNQLSDIEKQVNDIQMNLKDQGLSDEIHDLYIKFSKTADEATLKLLKQKLSDAENKIKGAEYQKQLSDIISKSGVSLDGLNNSKQAFSDSLENGIFDADTFNAINTYEVERKNAVDSINKAQKEGKITLEQQKILIEEINSLTKETDENAQKIKDTYTQISNALKETAQSGVQLLDTLGLIDEQTKVLLDSIPMFIDGMIAINTAISASNPILAMVEIINLGIQGIITLINWKDAEKKKQEQINKLLSQRNELEKDYNTLKDKKYGQSKLEQLYGDYKKQSEYQQKYLDAQQRYNDAKKKFDEEANRVNLFGQKKTDEKKLGEYKAEMEQALKDMETYKDKVNSIIYDIADALGIGVQSIAGTITGELEKALDNGLSLNDFEKNLKAALKKSFRNAVISNIVDQVMMNQIRQYVTTLTEQLAKDPNNIDGAINTFNQQVTELWEKNKPLFEKLFDPNGSFMKFFKDSGSIVSDGADAIKKSITEETGNRLALLFESISVNIQNIDRNVEVMARALQGTLKVEIMNAQQTGAIYAAEYKKAMGYK